MPKLAPMLDRLSRLDDAALRAGEGSARLVLSSGRRARVEGEGDFEAIGSAAIGEDDVRDLLSQTGVGSRLDRLDHRPIGWTFRHEGATFVAEAVVQGRDLKATIRRQREGEVQRPTRPTTGDPGTAIREEMASRQRDPRADEAVGRGGGATREETVRGRTRDPRADEDAPPRSRGERRRESRARRATPPPEADPARTPTKREGRSSDRHAAAPRGPARRPSPQGTAELPPRRAPSASSPDEDVWKGVVGGGRSAFDLDDAHDRPTLDAESLARATGQRAPTAPDPAKLRALERESGLPPVFGLGPPAAPLPPPRAPSDLPPPNLPPPRAPSDLPPPDRPPARAPSEVPPPPRAPRAPSDLPPPATELAPSAAASPPPPEDPKAISVLPPTEAAGAKAKPAIAAPAPSGPRLDPRLARLVEQARAGGASDLHVVAGRPAIARIAGALRPAGAPLSESMVEEAIRASIPPGRRAVFERDGAVSFAVLLGDGASATRCRVAVSQTRTGLKASVRILHGVLPTVEDLALPPALDQATRHHQGLVVLSGPSGQGKTTTLAALVDHLNTNTTHHVLTVEDPIEYVHPRKKAMLSQREVGTHTKSFANALRSSLREDPDVIVVGELRDVETVRTALSAGETGHLVLGTLNTPSASKTIDRLIDLFPPPEQPQVRATLAGALRLIASQRLLPRRDGSGRVAAFEVLPGSLALSNLIRDARTFQIPSLMQRGRGAGVIRIDDELLDLTRRGIIDKKDALAAAEDPQELAAALEGRGKDDGRGGEAPRRPPTGPGPGAEPPRHPGGAQEPPSSQGEGDDRGKALWQRAADIFRRGGG